MFNPHKKESWVARCWHALTNRYAQSLTRATAINRLISGQTANGSCDPTVPGHSLAHRIVLVTFSLCDTEWSTVGKKYLTPIFFKKQLLFYWATALLWSKYLVGNIYGTAVMDDWLEWICVEPNKGASLALGKDPKTQICTFMLIFLNKT